MRSSLSEFARAGERLAGNSFWYCGNTIAVGELLEGTVLGGYAGTLHGRSVVIATASQLTAACLLLELDGLVRRLVVCPPDLASEHLPVVAATAGADMIISDLGTSGTLDLERIEPSRLQPATGHPPRDQETEWILLTSGTAGVPKMVVHDLSTLTGAIIHGSGSGEASVWGTFYDIRRYGGLQILLRALLGGSSLVIPYAGESVEDFLGRAGEHGVSRISGTPTHWRRALMSSAAQRIAPHYIRLSGEIADQAILDRLRTYYPGAAIGHAFASTEAGVAFEVSDGLAGFPASLIGQESGAVQMRVIDGSLRIRSARTGRRYLDADTPLADDDQFVDTGDMVERRGDRYHFVGRKGGIVNIGGLKVHPEEVEAVINKHPKVQMSLVRARKNPITGFLLAADVLLHAQPDGPGDCELLKGEIMAACGRGLAAHKVPVAIRFVSKLDVAASGKLARPVA